MELYVHIPFCARKCFYCDFLSFRAPEPVHEAVSYTHLDVYKRQILASVLYMPKGLYGIVEKIKGLFGRRVKADADN